MAFSMLYTTYELWMEVCDIVQGTGIKIIHKKKIKENNNNKTNKQTNKLRNYLVTQESLGRILRAPGAESSGILGT